MKNISANYQVLPIQRKKKILTNGSIGAYVYNQEENEFKWQFIGAVTTLHNIDAKYKHIEDGALMNVEQIKGKKNMLRGEIYFKSSDKCLYRIFKGKYVDFVDRMIDVDLE